MAGPYFTNGIFTFLKDLKANNDREWFNEHKSRYESAIKEPAFRMITDFQGPLKKISGHFRADPRPVGGSMFRIHRDTRFSKDKSPYKTAVGIHFRHDMAKDAYAPGFYLHIAPGECFLGAGIWHPQGPALKKIREAIAEDPKGWKRARDGKRFRESFELQGDSLKRPPRGFDPEHPMIEDLKRKDFIGVRSVPQKFVTSPDLPAELGKAFRDAGPFMKWLCGALDVPY